MRRENVHFVVVNRVVGPGRPWSTPGAVVFSEQHMLLR